MNRRTIAIIIIIVALILLSALGVFFLLQQDSGPAQQAGGEGTPAGAEDIPPGEEAPPGATAGNEFAGAETVSVVVSQNRLPRGFQITASDVITEERLASAVGSNVITEIDEVVGLYARTVIFQGETLVYDDLIIDPTIIGANEYGPSSLIPNGSVAAAMPLGRFSSVGYAMEEGDFIDILISFDFYQIDEEFQTYLQNSAVFFLEEALQPPAEGEEGGGEAATTADVVVISPYGRFEELPTGDLAHVGPSEPQRPVLVSMILQNAKVIQVGEWSPRDVVEGPTPTPQPTEEGGPTPTPGGPQITPTPPLPEVVLLALSPQQQLFLKYAMESNADIDYALRANQDGQSYAVQNVDLDYLLETFDIQPPPNFEYSIDAIRPDQEVTPTPDTGETAPEDS
jgi:Flp pilus assembly protein CpaB